MRIGCCISPENADVAAEAGYDYFEPAVGLIRPESPDSELEPVYEAIHQAEIVPEAWNCLLPPDMKIVGPEVDSYRIERYLRTAFHRIGELGGEIVVAGSADARRVPDGFPMDEARDQLAEFLTLCGQVAGPNGITIAVEPLNTTMTNILNSVPEALEMVRRVDHPFVKLVVDFYHMMADGRPLEDITAAKDEIVHVHVADTGGRYPGSGDWPIGKFIGMLADIGYDERVSIECRWDNFPVECVEAIGFLRGLVGAI
jgi:sugar phosphate isomerase/epimerase